MPKTSYYVIFPQPDRAINSSSEEKQYYERKKLNKQVKKSSVDLVRKQDELQTCSLLRAAPLDDIKPGNYNRCTDTCFWCERKRQAANRSISKSTSTDDLQQDYITSLNRLKFNETINEHEQQKKADKIDLSVYQVQNSNSEVKKTKVNEPQVEEQKTVNNPIVKSETPVKLCELTVYSVKFQAENRALFNTLDDFDIGYEQPGYHDKPFLDKNELKQAFKAVAHNNDREDENTEELTDYYNDIKSVLNVVFNQIVSDRKNGNETDKYNVKF